MYYQYSSGMEFKQAGGYVGTTPTAFSNLPLIASLLNEMPDPNFKTDLYRFCKAHAVIKIIYTPSISPYLKGALESLHWRTLVVGTATIISVPSSQ